MAQNLRSPLSEYSTHIVQVHRQSESPRGDFVIPLDTFLVGRHKQLCSLKLLHMTAGGSWNPCLSILSSVPYPLNYMPTLCKTCIHKPLWIALSDKISLCLETSRWKHNTLVLKNRASHMYVSAMKILTPSLQQTDHVSLIWRLTSIYHFLLLGGYTKNWCIVECSFW